MTVSSTPSKGKGRTIAIAGVVIVLVAIAAGYYLFAGMGTSNATTSSPATTTITIPNGTGASQSLNFSPQTIKVVLNVNNTIEWVNSDSATHSVTFTTAPAGVAASSLTDPSNLASGGNYKITLTTPGTYQYHCTFHSWMSGTIVVQSA